MQFSTILEQIEHEYCDALSVLEEIEERYVNAGGSWEVLAIVCSF